jgi:hypothetical protein
MSKTLLLAIVIAGGFAHNANAQPCTQNPFAPCLPYQQGPYQQPAPPGPSQALGQGNTCEARCRQEQSQCMNTCPQQHDWYRCFGQICADQQTICMQGCR